MAERVLFYIAGEIIKKLGSRALQEIGVWWGVKDELQKLKGTVSRIRAVLLDAEKKAALNEQVKDWLGELQEIVYDADDLIDDFATEALQRQVMTGNRMTKEVSLFFSSSNRLVYGFNMGHKIKVIRERLDAFDEDRKKYGLQHVERPEASFYSRGRNQTISYVDEKQVIGRENDRKAIIDLLLDSNIADNVSVIPIVGIGGLGKTTLAQYVFSDENVKTHFELKLWVCVSEVFDLKVVVEKTLKSIGREPGNFELDQLQTSLRDEIRGKKYLLVLDDVWNEDLQKWTDLKALLTCGARGSRILVTTRSEMVAAITSGKKTHYSLKGLDVDKSWSLFKKIVFEGKEPESPKVKEIGEQIIEKYVGVPLAIKTIASLLYFRDPEREWLPFLENDLSKIAQNENDILPTLQLSYDHLPSHLKHCFAYCALFPKDYVIDVKTLIHLWIAQGFIESSNSSLCDEDIGLQYFTELWWRSFFQEVERDEFGNIKSCKMHDLMHDLATSVAGKSICIINSKEKSVDKSIRHVSFYFRLCSSQQIPAGLSNALKLRTLLFNSTGESRLSISKVIVPNFRELRVCDMNRAKIEKVSNSINKLKHLRYLDVSHNEKIVALPNSITNLQNLQVLNVSWCSSLKELPKDIKKLINLRHLYCVGCSNLTHMPRGLGQLTSLRTLTRFVVAKDNSVAKNVGGLNELNSLNNLRGSLEIYNLGYVKNGIINPILKDKSLLQSLSLSSDRDDDANVESEEMAFQNLEPHPNLKKFTVYKYTGRRFPSWVSSLTNLVNIRLWNSRCQHLPPLDQFPSLQMLDIWGLNDLEYIEIKGQATSFFPSLKFLRLGACRKLIGMKRYEDDSDDSTTISSPDLLQFPCLSEFHCFGCLNLSLIPQFPSLDEELVLMPVSVQLVQQIFTTSTSSSSSSIVPPLSKLKKLIIWDIKDLEFLPPDGLHNLTSLQQLEIKRCPRLTSLPQEMLSLTSLRELTISGCPLLSKRCADKKGEDWPFISHIPNVQVDCKRIQWEGCYLLEDEEKSSTTSEN
ncbi:putative disease resistance protein RGA3 [Hevea brasiliensis]|uniref:putative disease resistance protein RGA3 n=1 Tax=Hevea brasiliensis TaxID=3981 RepID=UPI0025D064CE|nr:putative disease resistance protein RGA3 [Hevea brasiliensis]XP_057991550.1 putative disease resistance protein RGA3 [Hevea brasiliensis]